MISILLLLFAFCILVANSWRKWCDIQVDYGLQLYTPWQLASGKVLYRDVMYLAGGPFSQYFHAMLFKLFGVSLSTLIYANLAFLLLLLWMIQRAFAKTADYITAFIACLMMLIVFALGQYTGLANYNYVCPYTYETTHGLILSVAGIVCLWHWLDGGRNMMALMAGLCSGCVFLTKPDLSLAIAVTLIVACAIHLGGSRGSPSARWTGLIPVFFGFAVPAAVFIAYYSIVWSTGEGFKAVAGAWLPVLTTGATQNNFYRWCLGLDQPAQHLIQIVRYSAGLILGVGLLAVCARRIKRRDAFAWGLLALVAVLVWMSWNKPLWINAGYALGPATLLACVFLVWRWWKHRITPERGRIVFPLLWSVFALVLLAKMGFFTRIWHYGFYLAMPAALLLVFVLTWTLPRELERFEVNPTVFRALVMVFLAVGLIQLAGIAHGLLSREYVSVGDGGDQIRIPKVIEPVVGAGIEGAVEWIRNDSSPDQTVAVMPEGAMINYMTRRANSTPYLVFTYPEVVAYGEANMLKAYIQNSPDYIVLVQRDASEYGVKWFGFESGYGYDIMQWVHKNYAPVWLYGSEPLKSPNFGIEILKRNNLTSTTPSPNQN